MTGSLFDDDTGPLPPLPVVAARRRPAPASAAFDIERLSTDLGELAANPRCPPCARSPGHRFELLLALGGRLHPDARDRLELIELASHLAWARK